MRAQYRHQEFIDVVGEAAYRAFPNEKILDPAISVIPSNQGTGYQSAVGKPANELEEQEKTLYFERMAFLIEIPSIEETVNGNKLSLSLGGVRAYNYENFMGRRLRRSSRSSWALKIVSVSTFVFQQTGS